jgi:hypothetical protein
MKEVTTKRYTYRDASGRHWIRQSDLDTAIIQSSQENVADLGGSPDIVGWEEYGILLDEMIIAVIENRVANGQDIR